MSLDDDLSLSFASSMGIENIQDEYLDRSNLYTDLDQLEKSVDAEFEEYMNRARSFPFKQQDNKSLDDASVHSDYEIVGEDPANPDADQEDMDDGDNDSWQRYLANRHSDEHYQPQGDPSFSKSQSRSTSPGEYFGARSLPFDYDWQKQADSEEEQQEEEEEEGHLDNNIHVSSMNRAAGTIRLKSHILVIIQKWQQQQQQQESTENCHPKIIGFKICKYSSALLFSRKLISLATIDKSTKLPRHLPQIRATRDRITPPIYPKANLFQRIFRFIHSSAMPVQKSAASTATTAKSATTDSKCTIRQ